jgi:hypothetical protein
LAFLISAVYAVNIANNLRKTNFYSANYAEIKGVILRMNGF